MKGRVVIVMATQTVFMIPMSEALVVSRKAMVTVAVPEEDAGEEVRMKTMKEAVEDFGPREAAGVVGVVVLTRLVTMVEEGEAVGSTVMAGVQMEEEMQVSYH